MQYTYARASSLIRRAQEERGIPLSADSSQIDPALLMQTEVIIVIKTLQIFGDLVEQALAKLGPSIITRYLIDLAQDFNRFYHACHILVDDPDLCRARLAVVQCVRITLRNGLRLIGLQAPERI